MHFNQLSWEINHNHMLIKMCLVIRFPKQVSNQSPALLQDSSWRVKVDNNY